jgi:SecD/SecF fusion protein
MDRKLLNRFLLVVGCLLFAAYYIYPVYPLSLAATARKHLTKSDPKIEAILDKAAQAPIPKQWEIIKGEVADQNIDLRPHFSGIRLPTRIESDEQANRAILNYLQRESLPKITLGLDLQGGTSFLVRLDTKDLPQQQLETVQQQAIEILRKRIDRFGVSEPIIQPVGKDRINIQIPGLSEDRRADAKTQIEKVARLEFRLVHPESAQFIAQNKIPPGYEKKFEREYDEDTKKFVNRAVLVTIRSELTGKSLKNAYVSRDELGQFAIGFELDSAGAERFAKLTREHIGEQLAIVLDGEVKSAPAIRSEIPSGRGEITGGRGGFSPEEAFELTGVLNNPLETPVEILQVQSVEPSLGADSIASGIKAGILSLILVAMFMGIYYLRAGWITVVALMFNMILLIGVLATFQFTLTLPGIAGLVLTIGVAVDANVLIYERIRENLINGQDLRIAVREGFDKAFWTIIDANMTTLITALVLAWFGTGPVQGFGIVLSVGVCTTVFSALVVTRLLFDFFIYKTGWEKMTMLSFIGNTNINFLRWRWPTAALSAALILAGVFVTYQKGSDALGVDFVGGDALTLSYKQKVDVSQIRDALEANVSKDNTIQYQSGDQLQIKTEFGKGEKSYEVLAKTFPQAGFAKEQLERVGPTVGRELTQTALISLAVAALGIMIYVSARFEFAYAVGALVALLHDVLITLALYIISGRELTLTAIGALLTVGGYSLNDTIVVFDRIREEVRNKGDRMNFADLINLSVNRVLGRTILTSLTTLLACACLLIFATGVINDFAFIMVVGVLAGTYSSVYIAAPILLFWHPSHLKPQENVTATHAEIRA